MKQWSWLSSFIFRSKPINIFMANQAVIDFTTCMASCMSEVFNRVNMVPDFLRPSFCIVWLSGFFMWVACGCSIYNLLYLTIERYFAITNPMHYDQDKVIKRMPYIILASWFTGTFVTIPVLFFYQYIHGTCMFTLPIRYPTLFELLTPYYLVVIILFPSVVMILAYVRMGLALRSSKFSSKSTKAAQTNLFQTCLLLMLVFLVTGLNHAVSLLLLQFEVIVNTVDQFQLSSALVIFNSCLNPYVYCIRYREFQTRIKQIVCKQSEESTPSNTSR